VEGRPLDGPELSRAQLAEGHGRPGGLSGPRRGASGRPVGSPPSA
jgi:hypothetical protein